MSRLLTQPVQKNGKPSRSERGAGASPAIAPKLAEGPRAGRPRHEKLQSHAELTQLYRQMGTGIFRPLAKGNRMQRTWTDGSPSEEVVGQFIKPNDRLTGFERLEIYNRQYWFRLLDCLYEDFPGIRALIGESKWDLLARAYLTKYPSRSYSLRNLSSRMARFLEEEPQHAGNRAQIAAEMAKFEWAQIEAFDGPQHPAVTLSDLVGRPPSRVKLAVQPYITFLELSYPLDDFVLGIKKGRLRADASNAVEERKLREGKPVKLPKKSRTFLAVHRAELSIYYKRLEAPAYHILCALRDGMDLESSCGYAIAKTERDDWAPRVAEWFSNWTRMGWFCRR